MVIGPAIGLAFLFQAGAPQAPLPEVVTRSRVNHARGVDFHALVVPETVYVGQQATYELGVFLDQDTRQRIRRNPEFQPPETQSLMSYDLRERGTGAINGTIDGRPYEIHVFRRALFPLTPGRYTIPAARFTYALPQTSSFFSREESYSLRADEVAFVAILPPAAGRPSDWTGAVGNFSASVKVDAERPRTGEPFVLTMRIEGQGNVTLLPRPSLAIPWATVVRADERAHLDSTLSILGGYKEFDWLVTPKAGGAQRIPALRYAFFNPRARRYDVASTAPFEVRVSGAALSVADSTAPPAPEPTDAPLEISPALGDPTSRPPGDSPLTIVLIVLAPAVGLGSWLSKRPKRARPAPVAAERLASHAEVADTGGVREIRRLLVDALRDRTGLESARLTEVGAWTEALRSQGVSAETSAAVEALIREMDAAAFAETPVAQPPGAGWTAQAREAVRLVDAEAWGTRRKKVGAGRTAIAVMMLAAVTSVARPQGTPDAQAAFALGTTAFAGGDYLRAARHFADAAAAAPRSADAWANFAAASYLAHDTASAVQGWQRALRLRPLDGETRSRLARFRAPQDSRLAAVPMVPRWLPMTGALLIWCGGWFLTAWVAWRRHRIWRIAAATVLLGGAATWYARGIEDQLEGRDLVIITAATPLRELPALGADPKSTPVPGEVARVVERRAAWLRVALDGGRDGWIPRERTAPLGTD